MRKVCNIVMLSAGEANAIANKVNEVDNQLKEIEEYIVKGASKGSFRLLLFPSVPYHPRTISTLEEYGYKVKKDYDKMTKTFNYEICWR